MFDLTQHMRRKLFVALNLGVRGTGMRHGQNLFVPHTLIFHPQNARPPGFHGAPGKGRMRHQDQHIKWIRKVPLRRNYWPGDLTIEYPHPQMNAAEITRRPLKSRETKLAKGIASWLAKAGVRPNSISVVGTCFAAMAGACLYAAGQTPWDARWVILMLLAICGIQLRLLCNLLDGMVAIEGGLKTKAGEIYNELPDRFSDAFIFIGSACSVPSVAATRDLGWAAAVLALITAYTRALGASMGAGQHFIGPMAKQHRMAVMTVACAVAALAPLRPEAAKVIPVALALIVAGCVVTIFRRCLRIAQIMRSK
jgi:phosphatidylglycerophosphate synthase